MSVQSSSEHKLLVLSDLHMDQWEASSMQAHAIAHLLRTKLPENFRAPELIVSAGDLAHAKPFGWEYGIKEIRSAFPGNTPLLLVPGNHDYYMAELDDAPLRAECELRRAKFGQKTVHHLGATRILTCTLWSDGLLFGEKHRPEVMRAVQGMLNDYRVIAKPGSPYAITATDTVRLHEEHLEWLTGELARTHDGPTVIITHHGPTPEASLPVDMVSAGFVSDLSSVIEEFQPDAWIFGHTHRPQSVMIGKTRVHNVGLGYPDEAKEHGVENLLLRGCLTVGDEVRFVMDETSRTPIRSVTTGLENDITST